MFRRQVIEPNPRPAASELRGSSTRGHAADGARRVGSAARRGFDEATRTLAELVRWPIERASWTLRHRLIWRLEDRAGSLGRPARAAGFGLVVLLAAGAGVAGLLWASPGSSPSSETTQAALAAAPLSQAQAKPKAPPAPTLHGVTPLFAPSRSQGTPAKLGAAEKIAANHHHAASASAASTETISSTPKTDATASAAQQSTEGKPAGPAAIAVAREFAGAFVFYETGQGSGNVRKTFGRTATPELARALLRRPPKQPAHVKVPRARVLNVVAAPSHGGVYPVSVSLLRVGLTSELRLSMELLKGKRWQVTNVLG